MCLIFQSNSSLFAQFRVSSFTIVIILSHLFCIRNSNYSIDQRSSNHNYSHHTQRVFTPDWLNYLRTPLPALFCSLMNALEREYLCFREISINVNTLLAVLLLPVYVFIRFFILLFDVTCLLLYPLIYLYWCCCIFLYICWSCKQGLYFYFGSFCLTFSEHYFPFRNSIVLAGSTYFFIFLAIYRVHDYKTIPPTNLWLPRRKRNNAQLMRPIDADQ